MQVLSSWGMHGLHSKRFFLVGNEVIIHRAKCRHTLHVVLVVYIVYTGGEPASPCGAHWFISWCTLCTLVGNQHLPVALTDLYHGVHCVHWWGTSISLWRSLIYIMVYIVYTGGEPASPCGAHWFISWCTLCTLVGNQHLPVALTDLYHGVHCVHWWGTSISLWRSLIYIMVYIVYTGGEPASPCGAHWFISWCTLCTLVGNQHLPVALTDLYFLHFCSKLSCRDHHRWNAALFSHNPAPALHMFLQCSGLLFAQGGVKQLLHEHQLFFAENPENSHLQAVLADYSQKEIHIAGTVHTRLRVNNPQRRGNFNTGCRFSSCCKCLKAGCLSRMELHCFTSPKAHAMSNEPPPWHLGDSEKAVML